LSGNADPARSTGRQVVAARKRRVPGSKRTRGFTLIEVLAALFLVALVLPAAMRGVSLATVAASETQRRAEAAALTYDKLNDLIATGGWSSEAPEGDFGEDHPAYTWRLTVDDWQGITVKQVMVRVFWESRGVERSLAMATLVYSGEG